VLVVVLALLPKHLIWSSVYTIHYRSSIAIDPLWSSSSFVICPRARDLITEFEAKHIPFHQIQCNHYGLNKKLHSCAMSSILGGIGHFVLSLFSVGV
jgi:hypothetical protein